RNRRCQPDQRWHADAVGARRRGDSGSRGFARAGAIYRRRRLFRARYQYARARHAPDLRRACGGPPRRGFCELEYSRPPRRHRHDRAVAGRADTGNVDISGTINVSGATAGVINIWAGHNLTLESSAVLNASAAIANANGNGGEVFLEADAANTGT